MKAAGDSADLAAYVLVFNINTISFSAAGNYANASTKIHIGVFNHIPASKTELVAAIETEMNKQTAKANLNNIDTSQITDMSLLFSQKTNTIAFNGDISEWDVSQVTDMSGMFHGAEIFNADISGWKVTQVIDFRDFRKLCALDDANTPDKFVKAGE